GTVRKVMGHSQNNPKDILGLFTCSATMLAVVGAARSGRLAAYLAAGAVAGLALTSHVVSMFHLPILATWILVTGRGTLRQRAAGLGGLLAVAVASVFVLWPWLWPAPSERVQLAYRTIRVFDLPMGGLYLGPAFA